MKEQSNIRISDLMDRILASPEVKSAFTHYPEGHGQYRIDQYKRLNKVPEGQRGDFDAYTWRSPAMAIRDLLYEHILTEAGIDVMEGSDFLISDRCLRIKTNLQESMKNLFMEADGQHVPGVGFPLVISEEQLEGYTRSIENVVAKIAKEQKIQPISAVMDYKAAAEEVAQKSNVKGHVIGLVRDYLPPEILEDEEKSEDINELAGDIEVFIENAILQRTIDRLGFQTDSLTNASADRYILSRRMLDRMQTILMRHAYDEAYEAKTDQNYSAAAHKAGSDAMRKTYKTLQSLDSVESRFHRTNSIVVDRIETEIENFLDRTMGPKPGVSLN